MTSDSPERPPAAAARAGAALLLLLAAWPWIRTGGGWPELLIQRLDHCPALACDFVLYYLPQVRQLYEAPGELVYGWVYPPLLAILLQGFKLLPDGAAAGLWTAINAGLAGWIGWMSYRRLPPGALSAALCLALVSLSLPVLHALKWGQVSLLVVALSLWGMLRCDRLGGAAIGLAAGIKLYPATFLALPLARRRYGAAAAGLATGLALGGLLPVLALGWRAARPFFTELLVMKDVSIAGLGGQALGPSMFRWFVDGRHIQRVPGPLPDASPLLLSLPGEVLLAWLAVAAVSGLSAWRLLDPGTRRPVAAALLACAAGLVLPPGWHHYFVFLPFAQACAMAHPGAPRGLGALSAILCAAPTLAMLELPDIYFSWSQWGGTTLAALAAWVGLLLIQPGGSDLSGDG